MSDLKVKEYKRFEDIKHVRTGGYIYWFAHEFSIELDYVRWRNFSKVLAKAKLACKNSGMIKLFQPIHCQRVECSL